ncbi:hypothetical protein Ddye_024956 [Dipteronia dyeriana]|uniref:Malectin-like domain-containing protein n=1 Tax=Dipteronia dyeriana TaxID=168575 RepID=A0AAD9TWU8_9ROSI|nr:hypothetical protein Ddye_024956 [Dipteronia dyeriana]
MMSSSSYLILLLVFNAYHFISSAVTTSIDCGASGSYTEGSIDWTGDEDLIQNGESIAVLSGIGLPRAMTTLRVFTTRKKNCYSIAAEKGTRYLLRATFYYGNYDSKSSPPVFDLQFDGNHWITVTTSMDTAIFHEVIYDAKGDDISVCVAQIFPNMFPFISAVEVRTLTPTMYNQVDANYGLILRRRVAFGTKDIVKYPDDNYDRIWFPAINSGIFTEATSSAIIANTLDDDPPTEVLRNAFMTQNTSTAIVLKANLPSMAVPILMNLYFSEVDVLDSTDERSFELYINDAIVSDPIIPPYGKAIQKYLKNFSASSNTSFYLGATSNSTLPPLINALEVFTITDLLTDGTSANDVGALGDLQKKFVKLQGWKGDPCLPSTFTWDWLNCSTTATPRVTALYLSGYDLSGSLPDFSFMDALETIELQNNSLNGPIPDFLGTLPKLKTLNLANNKFGGPVPSSLSKNTNLKLIVTGNPDLCASGKSCKTTNANTNTDTDTNTNSGTSTRKNKKKSNKLPATLGGAAAALVIFFVALGSLAILHQRRKSAAVAAAAATTGLATNKGGNGPNGGEAGLQMMGNAGRTVVNEFIVNAHDQSAVEAPNQMDHHQAHQGDHDTSSH